MAFTSSKTLGPYAMGNMRVTMGTYSQENTDTGGAIVTGLKTVKSFHATGALTVSDSSGTVTITTADPGADQTAYWMAFGY